MYLEHLQSRNDLEQLNDEELDELCSEIRRKIVDVTAVNGGHPASNLGCVELTVALHRVFDIPAEPLVFDVGHQSYTHKLLTGRLQQFGTLRQFDGLSGFQSPLESMADICSSGHSGSAISFAEGLAASRSIRKIPGKVIALVGDASLVNGVSLEGLNADTPGRENLVVVVNDNRMSISRSVGHLAKCLNQLSVGSTYNRIKDFFKTLFSGDGHRHRIRRFLRRIEHAVKGAILPHGVFFQNFGFRYIGPIDGHDLKALETVLRSIRTFKEPVLLHVLTEKGHGCSFMKENPTAFHGVSSFDVKTGRLNGSKPGFSAAFGDALSRLVQEHDDVRAITAAMLNGTGLASFAARFPGKCLDVGICEEHSVVFSAGLAAAGERPVCALYATFAQRALDCIYSDVVLPRLPVIFAFDRAGAVNDGPTHHGIYDLGFLRSLPGLDILCPRCESLMYPMLKVAYEVKRPVVLRYPRGTSPDILEQVPQRELVYGKAEILRNCDTPRFVIWGLGTETGTALQVAAILEKKGIGTVVVDPRWIAPFDVETARSFASVAQVTLEDHSVSGGLGDALAEALAGTGHAPVLRFGWPREIIPHGDIASLRKKYHFTAENIAEQLAATAPQGTEPLRQD